MIDMQETWAASTLYKIYDGFSFMMLLYSLLTAVGILILMRATGLLRREKRWQRALVCLYYLYIPVVFLLCGILWSSISSVESTVIATINNARPIISDMSAHYASSAWETIASTYKDNPSTSIKEICLTIATDYTNQITEKILPTPANSNEQTYLQSAIKRLKGGVAKSLAQAMENIALKKISEATSIDQEMLRSFWISDFTAILQAGFVCDVLIIQTKEVMKPFYFKAKLLFALLLLPAILETGLAMYRRKKASA